MSDRARRDPRSLEGVVAVVTGGAGELGMASARAMAERGARLVLVDRSEDALAQAAALLRPLTEVEAVIADVALEPDVERYVGAAVERFGRIDAFHNNAGIEGARRPFYDYDVDDFDRVMAVNVRGAFLGLKHVMRVMRDQRSGAIVNSCSVGSERGSMNGAAYSASKHALLGLTRDAAVTMAEFGVRVNAVEPGYMQTRMVRDIVRSQDGDITRLQRAVPLGRLGDPSEVGEVVAFLLSDAASYMTGAAVPIDGGLLAGVAR